MKNSLLLMVIAALAPALALSATDQPPPLDEVLARDFEVVTLEGERIPFSDLVGADVPVVVDFWATWCSPCRKLIPHMVKLRESNSEDRLRIVGLTIEDPDEDVEKVKRFAEELGINYTIAFAPAELFRFMNRREKLGVPKVLIFDVDGRVVKHITSYSFLTRRRISSAVSSAMKTLESAE